MRGLLTFSLVILLVTVFCQFAFGATINVPADQPTIQEGINAASNSDTVLVADGLYSGPGNYNITTYGKDILVASASGSPACTIDVTVAGADAFRLVDEGSTGNSRIQGFTILHASVGVYLEESSTSLANNRFDSCGTGVSVTGNYEPSGFGATITGCTFEHTGTGVFLFTYGDNTIDSCSFQNISGSGVSLWMDFGGTNSVTRCDFDSCGTGIDAGSVYWLPLLTVDSCSFTDNTLAVYGGMALSNSIVNGGVDGIRGNLEYAAMNYTVSNCEVRNLTGTAFTAADQASISNCIVEDNAGTIIYGNSYEETYIRLTISNCQLINNGGGISVGHWDTYLTISNTIYENNGAGISFAGTLRGGLTAVNSEFKSIDDEVFAIDAYESPVNISGCLFENNLSNFLIYTSDTSCVISNCTFVGTGATGLTLQYGVGSVSIDRNIMFQSGGPLLDIGGSYTGSLSVNCNDFYDYGIGFQGIPNPIGSNDNFSADPMFCDLLEYDLLDVSPCAAAQSPCGQLVGARAVACTLYTGPVWHVSTWGSDSTGDGSLGYPYATIQRGLDAASSGDTVRVSSGTYSGPGNWDLSFNGKGVVLESVAGRDSTIIDIISFDGVTYRTGFVFNQNEDTTSQVSGFTITNGDSYPGAIGITNASPVFRDCSISNSGSPSIFATAAVECSTSAAIFENCIFEGNNIGCSDCKNSNLDVGVTGGAALNISAGSDIVLSNCQFLYNGNDDAGPGGAVAVVSSKARFDNCVFIGNMIGSDANYAFGAALAGASAVVDFSDCLLQGNDASDGGGAIYLESCDTVNFDGCEFFDNFASRLPGNGGGAVLTTTTIPIYTNCTFVNNSVNGSGGGAVFGDGHFISCRFVENRDGYPDQYFPGRGGAVRGSGIFEYCLFDGNRAEGEATYDPAKGGAIYGSGSLENCTFVGNSADSGSAAYAVDSGFTITNCIVAYSHDSLGTVNAVEGPATASCTDVYGHVVGNWTGGLAGQGTLNNNMEVDPLFCDTTAGDFGVADISSCAAANNACSSNFGSEGVTCTAYGGTARYVANWGQDLPTSGGELDPYQTISYAIQASVSGDSIILHPGTYEGEGNWDLSFGDRNLVLTALSDTLSQTILVCGNGADPHHWGVWLTASQDSTTVIEGLTFTDTDPVTISSEPAIRLDGSSAVIRNCEFTDLGLAGAMKVNGGNPLIDSCNFANCQAGNSALKEGRGSDVWSCGGTGLYSNGGAIEITGGSSATLRDCQFTNNIADYQNGGAIAISGSTPLIEDCQFTGNASIYDAAGGHVSLCSGADAVFKRCVFTGGQAGFSVGGAIACDGSSPTFDSCIFTGNFAPYGGGALHCQNAAAPTFSFCQFQNNYADLAGGALLLEGGSQPSFQNCTIKGSWAGEDADIDGQVLAAGETSEATFVNCLIAFNGNTGGPVACGDPGSVPLFSCSNIFNTNNNSWVGCISSQLGINHNYSIDPDFCNGLEIEPPR